MIGSTDVVLVSTGTAPHTVVSTMTPGAHCAGYGSLAPCDVVGSYGMVGAGVPGMAIVAPTRKSWKAVFPALTVVRSSSEMSNFLAIIIGVSPTLIS